MRLANESFDDSRRMEELRREWMNRCIKIQAIYLVAVSKTLEKLLIQFL